MTHRSTGRVSLAAVVIAAAALLAGCQPDQETESRPETGQTSPEAPPGTVREAEKEQGSGVPEALPESAEPAVAAAAREDAASRLGVPPEDVTLLEARPVYWRTSALGCPDPDMSYAQVLTKGWLIRLAVGRSEYRYHAGESGEPFTCDPRRAEPPLESSVD